MSPIGSYVGGLTSKGQVGVLLWEHRGWILRMASLYKGQTVCRMQAIRLKRQEGGTRNDEKPANKNQVLFIVRRNYRSSKFGRT